MLKNLAGYNDIYAKWLSQNLHCLNETSVMLLDKFSIKSEREVRLSLVTHFDYN
jgi:hypothetical protein